LERLQQVQRERQVAPLTIGSLTTRIAEEARLEALEVVLKARGSG
jgi:hypothetical protein